MKKDIILSGSNCIMLHSLYTAIAFTIVWLIIVPFFLAFLLGIIAYAVKDNEPSGEAKANQTVS